MVRAARCVALLALLASAAAFSQQQQRPPPPPPASSAQATSAAAEAQRSSQVEQRFEAWAQGAGIRAPKLTHALFPGLDPGGGALRGLAALTDIAANQQLVSLPESASLRLRPKEPSPFKAWVPDEAWARQPWYAQLALKLLWEKQLGDSSTVSGYVELLPAPGTFQTPLHWSEDQLAALRYPSLEGSARRQRKMWAQLYADLQQQCPEGAGRSISETDFVWAMECVLSRAFTGSFGANTAALGVAALAVAAGAWTSLTTSEPWGLLCAAAVLLPLSLPELLSTLGQGAPASDKQDRVLVPFVDSMNHDSRVPTALGFSPLKRGFAVSVGRAARAGDQVHISYGNRGNDELLQFYGFVETDNAHDEFIFEPPGGSKPLRLRRGGVLAGGGEGGDRALLRELYQDALDRMTPTSDEEAAVSGGGESGARMALAHQFRREKLRLLQEGLAALT